jgi:hypothetical protein
MWATIGLLERIPASVQDARPCRKQSMNLARLPFQGDKKLSVVWTIFFASRDHYTEFRFAIYVILFWSCWIIIWESERDSAKV